jgi:hypothetical protein
MRDLPKHVEDAGTCLARNAKFLMVSNQEGGIGCGINCMQVKDLPAF